MDPASQVYMSALVLFGAIGVLLWGWLMRRLGHSWVDLVMDLRGSLHTDGHLRRHRPLRHDARRGPPTAGGLSGESAAASGSSGPDGDWCALRHAASSALGLGRIG